MKLVQFIREYHDEYFRLALRFVHNDHQAANDVLQETFIVLIKNTVEGRLRPGKTLPELKGWARRIVYYKSMHHLCKEANQRRLCKQHGLDGNAVVNDASCHLADGMPVNGRVEMSHVLDIQVQELVNIIYSELKQERDRQILIGFYYYQMTPEDLSVQLGLSIKTVYGACARFRERITLLLKQHGLGVAGYLALLDHRIAQRRAKRHAPEKRGGVENKQVPEDFPVTFDLPPRSTMSDDTTTTP